MHIRFIITILCLILSGTVAGLAQVNIEKVRDVGKEGFSVTIDGDIALSRGNNDLYEIGLGTRLDFRSGKNQAFLLGRYHYGKSEGNIFRNHAFVHLRFVRELNRRFAVESFGQVEKDEFTRLSRRLLWGAGIRITYLEGKRVRLYQGTSYMLEYERLDENMIVEHPAEITAHRWNNYLSFTLNITEQLLLTSAVYVQPCFEEFGDVRVLEESSFDYKITDHVGIKTTFRLRYDSRQPENIEDLDMSLSNGISLWF